MPKLFVVIILGTLAAFSAGIAQEAKRGDGPQVTAIAPVSASPGENITLRLRGLKLADATAIIFSGAPTLSAQITSKKAAAVPNGADAKDVGDTQLEANFSVPPDQAPGVISFCVETAAGKTPLRELRITEHAGAARLVEK